MASSLNRGLVLALVTLIVFSSSFRTISVANARSPYNRARQLATDCNSSRQVDLVGCGGGSGGGSGTGGSSRPGGATPIGSSRCSNGCCSTNKFEECVCC